MASTKKLVQTAKKWHRIAVASRKRISWTRPLTDRGHFVVYTNEGRWFMIPLAYLNTNIFRELSRMAEEEFGIAGPITVPCDSSIVDYIISMIQRQVCEDLEKMVIGSLASCRYSSSVKNQERTSQQFLIPSL